MGDTAKSGRLGGGERGYSFGIGETGSPFMVSGELFLRSTQSLLFSSGGGPAGSSSNRRADADAPAAAAAGLHHHPSAALLAGLSPDLRDLLLCHPDVHASGASATTVADNGLLGLVSSARVERRTVRRKRIEYLETSKAIAGCLATARLSAVRRAGEGFREGCAQGSVQLDSRLQALVLRFASAVSAEMAAEDAQTAAEGRHCRRETERLELAARLASLAATAEHRTRGSVVLRRLPPTHPQHARCLRAATENVKPGFFSSKSPYGAVQVLDIYKIENRVLLERFQRAAEATGPCKVKGLFCHVPDESLEHVVLYGMGGGAGVSLDGCCTGGSGGRGSGAESPSSAAGWDGGSIDLCWGEEGAAAKLSAAGGGGGRGKGSAGEKDARGGGGGGGGKRPLEFPRAFSRHSTLEEEYGYANSSRECDDEEECGGARRHRGPRSSLPAAGVAGGAQEVSPPPPADSRPPPQRRQRRAPGEGTAAEVERHGAAISGLRFLALCRVMIGSMHVATTVPSPTTAARGSGGGRGSGGSTSPRGSPSPGVGTSSAATKRHLREAPSSCSSGAEPGPGVDPIALPPPPSGQAEFDSVYFPREEEYRLLNEAFVLPEFLVVHRFVAGSPTRHTNHNASSVLAAASFDAGASISAGKAGERQQQAAAAAAAGCVSAVSGVGGGARRAAEDRGERARRPPQHQQHGRAKAGLAPPPSASPVSQDAASVVAEIEAAIERTALPQTNSDLPYGGGGGGGGGSGSGSPVPREAVVNPFFGGGDLAPSISDEVGAASDGSDGGRGEGRGRYRGSGRVVRDSIVGDVALEFERHWQELERLREAQKDEVAKTALSRRKLRQPP